MRDSSQAGQRGLRSLVLRGLAWKGASQLASQVLAVTVGVALARLLTPGEYGLARMALVFSALADIFTDLALSSALVQRREISEADRSTVFWTNVAVGAALSLLALTLAGPIAGFYGEAEVRDLFAALAVVFLIRSLATTQAALLARELRFRATELCELAAVAAGGAVAITAAAAGLGPWSLIVQSATFATVLTALLWTVSPWRPSLRYSLRSLRDLGGFSAGVFGSRLLFYLHRNADDVLIGRYLGASALGAYSLAYNLILLPFTRVVDPLRSVLFPALSRLQEDRERLASLWLRGTRIVAAVLVPALLGLLAVAPDFVDVVLDRRWAEATTVLQILAVGGVLQSLAALNSVLLPVLDRTATLFRFAVVTAVLSLVGFAVGLNWGIDGVAAGYLAANVIVVPLYSVVTARALGVPWTGFASAIGGVLQAGVGMLVVVVVARGLLTEAGVSATTRLFAIILLGTAVFLPLCAWRAPELRSELATLKRWRKGPDLDA